MLISIPRIMTDVPLCPENYVAHLKWDQLTQFHFVCFFIAYFVRIKYLN